MTCCVFLNFFIKSSLDLVAMTLEAVELRIKTSRTTYTQSLYLASPKNQCLYVIFASFIDQQEAWPEFLFTLFLWPHCYVFYFLRNYARPKKVDLIRPNVLSTNNNLISHLFYSKLRWRLSWKWIFVTYKCVRVRMVFMHVHSTYWTLTRVIYCDVR